MSDKELIKEEIERQKSFYKKTFDVLHPDDLDATIAYAHIELLDRLLQFIDSLSEEHTSDELEEAAKEYSFNIPTQLEADIVWKKETEKHFKDGAKWQLNQMKETLQTEYEKGRFDMREEMVKNIVLETKVMMDCDGDGIEIPYEEWLTLENAEIPYIPEELGLKEGDKVKIIIVKED